MKYMTGNIMDYIGRPDAICITTNGFITSSGAGELSYNFNGIRAICESILDDRFWMCSFKPQDFGR